MWLATPTAAALLHLGLLDAEPFLGSTCHSLTFALALRTKNEFAENQIRSLMRPGACEWSKFSSGLLTDKHIPFPS